MKPDRPEPDYYKKRRSDRTQVDATTRLVGQPNWCSVEVKVRDLSPSGFMAECADPVEIGSYVTLDVPGIGPVEAQVRWQIGQRMGGMFLDPISLGSFEWSAVKADPSIPAA